jgi:hypothetical protein
MSSAATVYQTLNLIPITCAALAGSTAARRRGLDRVGMRSETLENEVLPAPLPDLVVSCGRHGHLAVECAHAGSPDASVMISMRWPSGSRK